MNNTITLSGKIETIFPVETYGNIEKRVIWISEQGVQYPNTWSLEFIQGQVNILDNYKSGDLVVCKVDIKGRYWQKGDRSGVITTLKCWAIERQAGQPAQQQAAPRPQPAPQATNRPPAASQADIGDDDAPF